MENLKVNYNNIDEYIAAFPENIQVILEEMREVIRAAAPEAKEKISFQMPAFEMNGILVYFAAFKKHVSFFPTASGITAFESELTGYKISKGTIQLPLDQPLPIELISKIVKYRVSENLQKPIKGKKVK